MAATERSPHPRKAQTLRDRAAQASYSDLDAFPRMFSFSEHST